MGSVQISKAFPFVDDCEQAHHAEVYLLDVVSAGKQLSNLLGHELITFEHVFLLEEHVPEFVQIFVTFKAQFFGFPCAPILLLFFNLSSNAAELTNVFLGGIVHVVDGEFVCLAIARIELTFGLTCRSLFEIVPVYSTH